MRKSAIFLVLSFFFLPFIVIWVETLWFYLNELEEDNSIIGYSIDLRYDDESELYFAFESEPQNRNALNRIADF